MNSILEKVNHNLPYSFPSFLLAALFWFEFGFQVIPLAPKSKVTAVKWNPWLEGLSIEKITAYWTQHPDHEVGFIVGNDIIVFDADSTQSLAKLNEIEKAFDATPLLITKTKKGVHHFFKRSKDVFAKSDSHSTVAHPDRLDVKTGRAMVILAPSTWKEVEICEVDSADELTEVGQDLVDAIARHNGRSVPRAHQPREATEVSVILSTDHKMLAAILSLTSPDCGYEDWLQILMAIYHETGGSDDGLGLAISWSSKGQSYKGSAEIESKWKTFKSGVANPITIKSLTKKLDDQGIDWIGLCSAEEDPFQVIDDFVSQGTASESDLTTNTISESEEVIYVNPFDKFSLKGKSAEIAKNAIEPLYVLDGIAIKGQYTNIYAAPNTGKTLCTMKLLCDAISNGCVDPSKVFYLNMDDTATGLLEKNLIAETAGFNMLSEGYLDFKAKDFLTSLTEMISNDTAKDVVAVLDTSKKFFDVMSKKESSEFNQIVRPFITKGGTVIALAHTNKNLDKNGKPKFGGTSDSLDDCDCAYTLSTVSKEINVKTVEFENIKLRGNNLNKVSYQYSVEDGSSYGDILLSVEKVGENKIKSIKQREELKTDAELIGIVVDTINEGINTKMEILTAVAKKSGVSKGKIKIVIEKYTGLDPEIHKWSFTTGNHGAQVFSLLDQK